jgi:hypothetical protein
MRTFVSTLAIAAAIAFTGPAFAGDTSSAKNQADCEAAGGMLDAQISACIEKE